MTHDIERLAKEAGVSELIDFRSDHGSCDPFFEIYPEQLAQFAALIAEECAKECEMVVREYRGNQVYGAALCADYIRAKYPMPTQSDTKDAAK